MNLSKKHIMATLVFLTKGEGGNKKYSLPKKWRRLGLVVATDLVAL